MAYNIPNTFDKPEIRIPLGCHCPIAKIILKLPFVPKDWARASQVTSEFRRYMTNMLEREKQLISPKSSGSREPGELVGERLERGITGWCGERQGPYCAQRTDRHGDLREPISLQLCWTRVTYSSLLPPAHPKVARLAGWRDRVCVWWSKSRSSLGLQPISKVKTLSRYYG